jgi:hypothetical protein
MPHLVVDGTIDCEQYATHTPGRVHRWGRAVLKTEAYWLRHDPPAVLAQGVVVELARPLHPVALVTPADHETVIRLWPLVQVERTPAVQRWLATLAAELQLYGAGAVRSTTLRQDALEGLDLPTAGS